jgi:hypothetical protein
MLGFFNMQLCERGFTIQIQYLKKSEYKISEI